MDINFIDKDHLIIVPSTTANVAIKCDNCSLWYQNDLRLQHSFEKLGSSSLDTETHLWNALAFIYGVSWKSIKNYNSKKGSNFLKTPGDLRFCNNCTSLLNDNYNAHLKFEQCSASSSIVQLLKEFRGYPISDSEEQTDVQYWSNDLVETVETVEGEMKVDLDEEFVLPEDPEKDPLQSEEQVEMKYEPPSTFTEDFSDQNTSEQFGSEGSPALIRLQPRQLVIQTQRPPPEEIQEIHAITVKNLGNLCCTSATNIVNLKEKSPALEKNIIRAAQNLKSPTTATKPKLEFNPSLSFKEKVNLIMEKNKDNTECCRIKLNNQFLCTMCGKVFKSFDYLKFRHWRTHQENSDIVCVCDICGKAVKKLYMKEHKILEHATEEEKNTYKIKCNLCDEIVLSFNMPYHLNLKHKELKYSCELCDHKAYTKSELDDHKNTHTEVRKFICDECGKTFKHSSHYRRHMKCHKEIAEKGGWSFTCELCVGRTFKHSLSLKRHMERVHGNKKYECPVCSKLLSSPAILRAHENIHKRNNQD